ncbi:MAG: hypothetical protein WCT01_00560 [Candidatus Shapirobacteria bacterium]
MACEITVGLKRGGPITEVVYIATEVGIVKPQDLGVDSSVLISTCSERTDVTWTAGTGPKASILVTKCGEDIKIRTPIEAEGGITRVTIQPDQELLINSANTFPEVRKIAHKTTSSLN